jgi:hypothetical protein
MALAFHIGKASKDIRCPKFTHLASEEDSDC